MSLKLLFEIFNFFNPLSFNFFKILTLLVPIKEVFSNKLLSIFNVVKALPPLVIKLSKGP